MSLINSWSDLTICIFCRQIAYKRRIFCYQCILFLQK